MATILQTTFFDKFNDAYSQGSKWQWVNTGSGNDGHVGIPYITVTS